jgi:xanthine dehydrogenase accessory factor
MIKGKLANTVTQLTTDRVPFALATVVRARRPTSVRPGDTAVVLADGTIDGFVGGQCAESSVRLYALRALETGEALLLRLIPGVGQGDEAPDGLDGAIVEHNSCLSGGALEIFIEPQLPASRIVIVGGSPVARSLEELAAAAGYAGETRSGVPEPELSGVTAVVVASHGNDEEQVLTAALASGVPYVALVASPKRGEAIRASLDLPPELSAQLHTPAGLDLGARSPHEIAISILAEMIAVLHSDPAPERPAAGVDEVVEEVARPPASVVVAASADVDEATPGPPSVTGTAIDPVCGMKVAAVESSPYLDVADVRYYFCGAGCRSAYASQHDSEGVAR